jgi:predicted nucleotidyltransferase component of viral defense system
MLPKKDFFETYSQKSGMRGIGRNVLHEFLQMEILSSLSASKSGENISFLGGTALRFAYNIRRFSEDLDFDLINKKKFDLKVLEQEIKKLLEQKGYSIETKIKTTDNIHIIYWKFLGVLQEFGMNVPKDDTFCQ